MIRLHRIAIVWEYIRMLWKPIVFLVSAIAVAIGLALALPTIAQAADYDDLGGEPARMAFACKDRNSFDRVVAALERSPERVQDTSGLFRNGTRALLKGTPVDPGGLGTGSSTYLYETEDYEGTTVVAYRMRLPNGKDAWVAVWFSDDYIENA